MIPLRVYVEGFMSYRDAAELQFDGAPLWMLSGPNGAGKSTIFDAITYALYGLHRGGKQDARELINHHSDGLVVEFDFSSGSKAYRVRRTLSRRARTNASFQAFQLPDANSGTLVPRAVPETESKAGFERWIDETLGLDETTFTASVLLQQGKSDALLEANPAARHAMLSQIVDLSAYEALHQKADSRRKEFETQSRLLETQLQGIDPVEDSEIERLGIAAAAAREEVAKYQAQLQQLAALKVHAERWSALHTERDNIDAALREAGALFEAAATIEREAKRYDELSGVVPQLTTILSQREQLIASTQKSQQLQAAAAHAAATLETTRREAHTLAEAAATLVTERTALQKAQTDAQQTLTRFSKAIYEIDELQRLSETVASFDNQLERFAPDLDRQIEELGREEAGLQEASGVLPWLNQFARARAEWSEQLSTMKGAQSKRPAVEEKLAALRAEQEAATERLPILVQQTNSAQEAATRTVTLLEELRKRIRRFETVDGKPECSACGQPLTPEHLAEERQRLQDELAELETSRQTTQREAATAQSELETLGTAIERMNREIYRLDCDLQALDTEIQTGRQTGRVAQEQGMEAINALPPSYRERVHPAPEKDAHYFQTEYPTVHDLQELRGTVQHLKALTAQLDGLKQQQRQRDQLQVQREQPAARLQILTSKYSEDDAIAIRADYSTAELTLEEVGPALENVESTLAQNETQRRANETATAAAQREQVESQGQARIEIERREHIEATLRQSEKQLPATWQEQAATLTGAQLDELSDELKSLEGATERFVELQTAQREHQSQIARQRQIGDELAAIPAAAQRAPETVEAEATEVRGQERAQLQAAQEAEAERNSLLERRLRREELEAEYHRAMLSGRLNKTLSELLGRDRLQRYLLQQAESAIVANANHVLDRISGGNLRLELRRAEEPEGDEKARIPKALDLIAFNTQTSGESLPVYLLSGSQRFRVAVSLALGIGQYAGQGLGGQVLDAGDNTANERRIESVIIDEGFGSLDQEGRREIIDELHNLKSVLSRVILVSHQEEFADAFPNRYYIQLQNGTSTAQIVQES